MITEDELKELVKNQTEMIKRMDKFIYGLGSILGFLFTVALLVAYSKIGGSELLILIIAGIVLTIISIRNYRRTR